NYFGGDIMVGRDGAEWQQVPTEHRYADGNYRSIGAADLAQAIRTGRPHRASGALAFHVLEVMEAFQASSESGQHVRIASRPERPAMLPTDLAEGALDRGEVRPGGPRRIRNEGSADRLDGLARARAGELRPHHHRHAGGGAVQGPGRDLDRGLRRS